MAAGLARPAVAASLAAPHRGASALRGVSRSSPTELRGDAVAARNAEVRLIAGRALPPQRSAEGGERVAAGGTAFAQTRIQILPRQTAGENLLSG